jgi:hypothetical protein
MRLIGILCRGLPGAIGGFIRRCAGTTQQKASLTCSAKRCGLQAQAKIGGVFATGRHLGVVAQ